MVVLIFALVVVVIYLMYYPSLFGYKDRYPRVRFNKASRKQRAKAMAKRAKNLRRLEQRRKRMRAKDRL